MTMAAISIRRCLRVAGTNGAKTTSSSGPTAVMAMSATLLAIFVGSGPRSAATASDSGPVWSSGCSA
jgi:hypothetical protein